MPGRRTRGSECLSPAQTRAARGLLNWSADRLAAEAGLEHEAVHLFETGVCELGEHELRRLLAAIRGEDVIPVRASLAGEGVRFRRPPAPTGAQDPRTPFAAAGEALPDWLPFGQDGEDASPCVAGRA